MKAKRALWIVTMIPCTAIITAYSLFMSIFQILPGLIAVLELAMFRFECWSADVKRGDLYNCPFMCRTYRGEFMKAYEGGM